MRLNKLVFAFLFSFYALAAAYPLTDAIISAEARYHQGQAFYAKGDYIEANEAFKAAESIIDAAGTAVDIAVPAAPIIRPAKAAPVHIDIPRKDFSMTAKEAYSAGRFNDAIGLYKQALEKSPGDNNIKYNLAMAFLNNDDYQNAAYWLKEVVKNNSRDTDACYDLGVIYESFLPDYNQAVFYYRQFLKHAPSCPEADKVKEWIQYIESQTN
jgi:tetratricopeptide (TPR) repeat protein